MQLPIVCMEDINLSANDSLTVVSTLSVQTLANYTFY